MEFHDLEYERKSESGPWHMCTVRVHSIEWFEYVTNILLRHAYPCVAHRHRKELAVRSGLDRHHTALILGIDDRVLHEIIDDLLDRRLVCKDIRSMVRGVFQCHFSLLRERGELVDDGIDDLMHMH